MNCPYQEVILAMALLVDPLAHGKLSDLLQDNLSFSSQHPSALLHREGI